MQFEGQLPRTVTVVLAADHPPANMIFDSDHSSRDKESRLHAAGYYPCIVTLCTNQRDEVSFKGFSRKITTKLRRLTCFKRLYC